MEFEVCIQIGKPFVRESVVVSHAVQNAEDMTCKKRRLIRVEIMRKKRGLTSSMSSSSSSSLCSDSQPCALTRDEIRRKKNRESAERSRLRKLAYIDALSRQASAISDQYHKLVRENAKLRSQLPSNSHVFSMGSNGWGAQVQSVAAVSPSTTSSSSSSSLTSRSPASSSFPSHAGMYDDNTSDDCSSVSSITCPSARSAPPSPRRAAQQSAAVTEVMGAADNEVDFGELYEILSTDGSEVQPQHQQAQVVKICTTAASYPPLPPLLPLCSEDLDAAFEDFLDFDFSDSAMCGF